MNKYLDLTGLTLYNQLLLSKISSAFAKKTDIPEINDSEISANKLWSSYKISSKISGIYRVKGSVQKYENLPTSGMENGDVYNVIETGMNYVWDGEKWDALGGVFTESDPIFLASAAHKIVQNDVDFVQSWSGVTNESVTEILNSDTQ